jgi:hypothetical protein
MKRNLINVVIASVAAALGVIAISQAATSTRASAVKRNGQARFSALRRGRAASSSGTSALPALTVAHLGAAGTLVSELQLEPERAQFISITADTDGWVIPGRLGMCLAIRGRISITSTCGRLSNIDTAGLIMSRESANGPVIYGLVPDGASVAVTDRNGDTRTLTVTNDVFTASDPEAPSVSVRAAGGFVPTPVG